MQPLNILQVTNRIPYPLTDGGNIATFNVTRWLHKFGNHVTLASLNTNKHYFDPQKIPPVADVRAVNIDTTVRVFGALMGLFRSFPYNVQRFESPGFREMLTALLKEKQFDVVQLEGIYLAIYLDLFRKHFKGPVILRSHNVEHWIWQRLADSERNPLKRFYLSNLAKKIRAFELRALHQFDGIIPITETDAEWYREQGYKGAMKTVNAGVDLEKFRPAEIPPKPNTLCFLGSMEWQPNVEGLKWFLEKVWKPLQRRHPEAEFHVAGKNPPPEVLALKAPGMTMHGMVPDAVEFLNRYAIFVVPLLAGGGMRLKIVEAMALRKCIVSTPVGAEGIECTPGRDLLIAENAAGYVEKLSELLEKPAEIEGFGRAAEKIAREKYGYEQLVRQFESFYRQLI